MEAEERQNSAIEPRTNTYLLGHAEEEQIFLNAWKTEHCIIPGCFAA